jgi:hypothetical protein
MPWGDSAAVTTSAAPTERLAHPAHPVSMRSMTRRQVMERALSWVASGYEYKWYHSTESLAHRPTTHWHAARALRSRLVACLPCAALPQRLLRVRRHGLAHTAAVPAPSLLSAAHGGHDYRMPRLAARGRGHKLEPRAGLSHVFTRIPASSMSSQFPPFPLTTTPPQLCRLWSNETALEYVAWQMGGNWGKANQATAVTSTQTCTRRLHLLRAPTNQYRFVNQHAFGCGHPSLVLRVLDRSYIANKCFKYTQDKCNACITAARLTATCRRVGPKHSKETGSWDIPYTKSFGL